MGLQATSLQLTAAFDLNATFALAVNHNVIMIHNLHRTTYHPQPAVPAVHTLIQLSHRLSLLPNSSPTRLVSGTAGEDAGSYKMRKCEIEQV